MYLKRALSCILILVLLVPVQGCATLKNTKIPKAFKDVGVCANCKKLIALDDLADYDTAICPECGAPFIVRDARLGFKRKIATQKNQKAAKSFLAATWLAASVAGMIYGIPIPPPIINKETFSPYMAPLRISCRKARRAPDPIPYYYVTTIATHDSNGSYKNLYIPSKFPNPYEIEMSPYSVVINDYEGSPLKKLSEGSYSLMSEPVLIQGKPHLLEIKN